jgi:predicted GNAT family N-acyltransferase
MPRGREMSSSLPHPGRSEILGIGRLAVRGAQKGADNTTELFGRALRSLGVAYRELSILLRCALFAIYSEPLGEASPFDVCTLCM